MEQYGYQKKPEDKKVEVEVEAEATAKATALNKNWNVQYVNFINKSKFAENEVEKYAAAAADPQKVGDLVSKLEDKDDDKTKVKVKAEAEAEAKSKAIIYNKNVNQIFVDTKDNDVDI